jgi:hypothetical protein
MACTQKGLIEVIRKETTNVYDSNVDQSRSQWESLGDNNKYGGYSVPCGLVHLSGICRRRHHRIGGLYWQQYCSGCHGSACIWSILTLVPTRTLLAGDSPPMPAASSRQVAISFHFGVGGGEGAGPESENRV